MSLTAHLIALVVAALVTPTILVVGTLLAADIITLGRRDASSAPEPRDPADPEGPIGRVSGREEGVSARQ